ncbi:hypothetical protein RZR97_09030 [Hydrogenimonas thermophila]|uniref:hypothetical protein n=1 Tax=Hydrogenimonas thermophila TaxID=223786 RepID=UPI00293721C4|nr:hypothetical protein [Hydrogenimonas thermophila]WOE69253.1 hypothetical protein RZR91_09055 [Hydrogenimonas thermophila]WOE71763.1 hypothetical protein RZR97_09030 [Hydrogenimonas thermophila]
MTVQNSLTSQMPQMQDVQMQKRAENSAMDNQNNIMQKQQEMVQQQQQQQIAAMTGLGMQLDIKG